jgi:hypothetical protein
MDRETNTLYPFCLYTHSQYSKQPPDKEIERWLEALIKKLEETGSLEPPSLN